MLCALVLTVTPVSAQTSLAEAEAEAKANAAADRVGEARVRADSASSAFLAAESALEQVETKLAALQASVDDKKRELDTLKQQLKDFAVYRYISGGTDDSASMFSARDVNQAVAREALATLVGDRKVDVINKVKNAQAEYEAESAKLAAQQKQQKALTEEMAKRNDEIQRELATVQKELDGLNAIVAGLKEEERQRIRAAALARAREAARLAEEERQRKAAEEAARRAAAPPATPQPQGPGQIVCPVPGSSYSDSWGQARSGGRGHRGVDMIAPRGTPTYAPVTGDVSFGSDGLGGLSWYLWGDDGNFYYGTHLSAFGPRAGRVNAGDLIGYVGRTGNASIDHLHFEIHIGRRGNQVNPYPYVAAVC
jgi:murein DD-endopeptidase MepM/ murein hydrolase activator NlpD